MGDNTGPLPPDLPTLRLWIDRLASDYEKILAEESSHFGRREKRAHRKALSSLQRTCHGSVEGPAKSRIRELIAAGVVRYGIEQSIIPASRVPKQVIVDFSVFALWPLVITRGLPEASSFSSLQDITSERLAALVWEARASQQTSTPTSAGDFARRLADTTLAPGILNLLGDLSDPLRGGNALIAITFAATRAQPPKRPSPKTMIVWILSTAAGGVIGNNASQEWSTLWNWLMSNSSTQPVDHNSNPGTNNVSPIHGQTDHHSAPEHAIQATSTIADEISHWHS
jgi:hypothetical protein